MYACMQLLLAEGKIRGVGLSEVSAEQVRQAAAVVPIAAVELEWSLFTRDAEVGEGRDGERIGG
jgi:aryl-alcohol dehydrogenase-like predicted oxidoreductase